MCEASVYLVKGGEEKKIMQDVISVRPEGDTVFMATLLGEQKIVPGHISRIDFLKHTVFVEESPPE
jgi:predicted RNA-binding protein